MKLGDGVDHHASHDDDLELGALSATNLKCASVVRPKMTQDTSKRHPKKDTSES